MFFQMKVLVPAIIIIFAGLGLPSYARQHSEDLNATAQITAQLSSLSLYATRDLEFGVINRPNGTAPGHFCRYQLRYGGGLTARTLFEELDENGALDTIGLPTKSGCGSSTDLYGNARFGHVQVQCAPSFPVYISAHYTSNNVTGVDFGPAISVPTMVGIDDNDTNFGDVNGTNGVFICGEKVTTSGSIHQFVLLMGGQVTLSEEAEVTTGYARIGSITLDATY